MNVLKYRISELLAGNPSAACTRINNFTTLVYLKRDDLGRKIDKLSVVFNHVSGIPDGTSYPIESRVCSEIILEIQQYTTLYLLSVADRVVTDLQEGIASC